MNGSHQMILKLNQDTGEVTPQDLSLNQVESEFICENQDELSPEDQSKLTPEDQSEPTSQDQSEPRPENQDELSPEDPALDADSSLLDETVTPKEMALDADSSLIEETVSNQCAPDSERFLRASTPESDQGFMEGAICDYDELVQGEGTLSDDLNINAKSDDNKSDSGNIADPYLHALSDMESMHHEDSDKHLQDSNVNQDGNPESDSTVIYEYTKETTTPKH